MAISKKAIQGRGVIVLNIMRFFNVCGLILVAAAHWIMIVTSGMSNQFQFFDFATHLFMFALTIFLFLTELGVPAAFISQRWPVFGDNAGFLVLAGLQIAMGCFTLADLGKPAYFVDSIGLPLWRTILAAGILSIVFGFFNIPCTFIFESREQRVSARMVRDNGLLAEGNDASSYAASTRHGSSINSSLGGRHEKEFAHGQQQQQQSNWAQKAGRRLTQAFGRKPGGGVNNGADAYDAQQVHPASRDGGLSVYDDEQEIGVKPPAATSIHPLYRQAGFDDGLGGHQRNDSGDGGHRFTRYSLSSRISQFSERPPLPPNASMPSGPYDNLPGGRI